MKKLFISLMLLMSVAAANAQTGNDELTKEINQAIEASVGTLNFSQMMTTQLQPLVERGVIKAEKLKPLVKDVEAWMVPLLKERMAALYRQHFTLEEMKQVNAYLTSPIGQKFMKLTPEFSAAGVKIASTPEAQKKMQEIVLRYLEKE
jgi:hypothetical protein